MEILFKSDDKLFFIENDILQYKDICIFYNTNLENIPHLKDTSLLFTVLALTGEKYNVYYRYDNKEILEDGGYYFVCAIEETDIIDYTEANIRKLKNGNII